MDDLNSGEALDRFAAFYDLEYRDYAEDVPFYLNYASVYADASGLAGSAKPRVLELGCGTGRLLVSLAMDGCAVVGVDASAAMLAVAQERLATAGVDDYLLLRADMREVQLPSDYMADLVIIALNTFQYITSVAGQMATLRGVRPYLAEGGRLIVALPGPPIWPSGERLDNTMYLQGSFADGLGGTVQKWLTSTYDPVTQLEAVTFFYDEIRADGSLRRTLAPLTLRFTFRYEMEHLLAACGYALEGVYGSYELDALAADAAHMIFVARAASTL